jgi:hypothetical protein
MNNEEYQKIKKHLINKKFHNYTIIDLKLSKKFCYPNFVEITLVKPNFVVQGSYDMCLKILSILNDYYGFHNVLLYTPRERFTFAYGTLRSYAQY